MDNYLVKGGVPLSGSVSVHGAKNSVLPILAASILIPGESVIQNCPNVTDVTTALHILTHLGCHVTREEDTVIVEASHLTCCDIPAELIQKLPASILFLGALIARQGQAELSWSGGCFSSVHPIDLHIKALEQMGVQFAWNDETLQGQRNHLEAQRIALDFPSVGATETVMLIACCIPGITILKNAAREPEIVALQEFLRAMGVHIGGAGGSVIVIEGGVPLQPATYKVMPDRIVTATYLTAVAAATGEAEVMGADYRVISPVVCALIEAGCKVQSEKDRIWIKSNAPLQGIRPIITAPYPGFPTDVQPILMAALAGGIGTTHFIENIFSDRYSHVDALRNMGASIIVQGQMAQVRGVSRLHGASVQAHDLQGGAALVIAALGAEGYSTICGLSHINRGYQNLDIDLCQLGASVTHVTQEARHAINR